MARVYGTPPEKVGRFGDFTLFKRGNKVYARLAHTNQPRSMTRRQFEVRQRQRHNTALWHVLSGLDTVYFEGGKSPYHQFMAVNTYAPVPYLTRQQYANGNTLLLPNMVVSYGSLPSVHYQLGEVEGHAALLTNLAPHGTVSESYLLYVLRQSVYRAPATADQVLRLSITAEPVDPSCFVALPQAMSLSNESPLAMQTTWVDDRFADPMLGFALVRVRDSRVSHQQVVTRCSCFECFTTEQALQEAAASYGGLTGE